MALTEQEKKDLADYQALMNELDAEDEKKKPAFLMPGPLAAKSRADVARPGSDEQQFQAWKTTLPPNLQNDADYDLRGFFRKNPGWRPDAPGAHMTDEFKLPNHPTFSNESRYYNPSNSHLGGSWAGDKYTPNDPRIKAAVDESPGALPPAPAGPVETRPFLHSTGPDLVGQLRREAADRVPDADLTNTPGSMVSRYGIDASGKLGSNWIGTPAQEGRDFLKFSAGMVAPGAIAAGTENLLGGAVARSAARAAGEVAGAVKALPGQAVGGSAGKIARNAIIEGVGTAVGVPGLATAARMAVPVAKAGAMVADEGLAAAGRAIGIKPWAPTQWATAPASPASPRYMAGPAQFPQNVQPSDLVMLDGIRPPVSLPSELSPGLPHPVPRATADTGGIPNAVASEMTTPIPRQSMRELDPLGGRAGGVDLAAGQPARAALPDDTALLNKTQRIVMPEHPGWSRNARGTGYNKVDTTPSDTNVKPQPSLEDQLRASLNAKPVSPKMEAYRSSLKAAEEASFAKKMGKTVPEYRELLAKRAERFKGSVQAAQDTGNTKQLQDDIADEIFGEGGL